MNKFPFNLQKIVKSKVKRAYCRWAISKKKRVSSEWTDFEKQFATFMKRAVLSKTANLYYSIESGARILHNTETDLTIIIRGNSIRVHDDATIIAFNSPSDLGIYLDAIFDRANSLRAQKIEDLSKELMVNSLKEIQFGSDRKAVDFSKPEAKLKKVATILRKKPIPIPDRQYEDFLQGANQ